MLLSAVKFLFTPSAMISAGYGFVETLLITFAGATMGVLLFYYGGTAVFMWFDKLSGRGKKKARKIFSRRNRTIVTYKNKLGVGGLAATVGLISIPLCALLAAKYFHHKKKTIWVLLLSTAIWAFSLTALSFYFRSLFFG